MQAWSEPSEGEITRARGLTIGYVEQDVPSTLADTPFHAAVLDMLPRDRRASEGWRVDVALESLEVPEALRQRPLKQLSGGWQRMAMLARVVVAEADVLLLDEPTNHLDLARICQLGSVAERAAAGHAGRDSEPRPRLSRRHHEPHAILAARAVADIFVALYAGPGRAPRGGCLG